MKLFNRVIIARTDSIGDVILTLPMAGAMKMQQPNCEVLFIGRNYTRPVIESCVQVDQFISWDDLTSRSDREAIDYLKQLQADAIYFALPNKKLARLCSKANIPIRVGVSRRWFHWVYCNFRPGFSRRKSDLHEAQLNLKLMVDHWKKSTYHLGEINELCELSPQALLTPALKSLLKDNKQIVLLHPKSQGSAKEWPLEKFQALAHQLVHQNFKVLITGTEPEGKLIRNQFEFNDDIIDVTGKMSLDVFITLIDHSYGLVAASTGPLHIAATLGKKAIGLYSPLRPIHPGRWAPIGTQAQAIVSPNPLPSNITLKDDTSIEEIEPGQILNALVSS